MTSAAAAQARIDAALDELTEALAGGAEIAAARPGWELRRGRAHQDDGLWERWSAAFVEWFGVEAPGESGRSRAAAWSGKSADPVAQLALASSHRSIFELVRQRGRQVELLDLLGGARWTLEDVGEVAALIGCGPGDLVELRLVALDGEVRLGRTFVFHPQAVRDAARAWIARARAAGRMRLDVVDELARRRLAYERAIDPRHGVTRSRQTAARRIYEGDAANVTVPKLGAE